MLSLDGSWPATNYWTTNFIHTTEAHITKKTPLPTGLLLPLAYPLQQVSVYHTVTKQQLSSSVIMSLYVQNMAKYCRRAFGSC
jgi:hypothetical protein